MSAQRKARALHLDRPATGELSRAGRRRAAASSGELTRQRLLDAAGGLWAERGFQDATATEIARRAQASLASINFHFGSREGLRRAVLAQVRLQLQGFRDDVAKALMVAASPLERLGVFVDRFLGTDGRRPPWGLRVLAREALLAPSPASASIDSLRDLLRPLLAELLELPGEHPGIANAAGWVMLPMLVWLVAQPLGQGSSPDPEAARNDLLHYFAGGLLAMREAHRPQP